MRNSLNSILPYDYLVHSFTVWYLLFPRCLHLTISRIHSLVDLYFSSDRLPYSSVGWSVFLCWSFAVFIRWLIRVSLLIVCRIHSLADPCFFADRLPYSSVDWSVFLCWSFAVYICRWSFVVPDRLPFTFAADPLSFLIVCRLLLPLIVCRSWSFAVYFCHWSFAVADRCCLLLSLIVCRFLSLLIVCSSFLLLIICSPTRQIICHILLLWLICIFVTDRSPCFLADRCRPSVANCFGTSS